MRSAWAVLLLSACGVEPAPRLEGRLARVDPQPACTSVSPLELDFGEVESGVPMGATADLTLHNLTGKPRVVRVDPLGAPFFFTSGFVTLEPFGSLVQTLLFAPSDALLHLDTLVLDDGVCASRVRLRGLGSGRLEHPSFVNFGSVAPHQEVSRDFVIRSSRRVPVTLSLSGVTDGFRVSPTTVVVPAQGEARLTVTAAPQVLGPLMGSMLFDADVGPSMAVGLAVRSQGSLALFSSPVVSAPRAGLWPAASEPGFIERTLEFMSTVDPAQPRQVRVLAVSYAADAGSTSELSVTLGPELLAGLAPGEHGTATLRFEPFSLGAHVYHLQFLVAGPGEPPIDVTFTAQVSDLPDCEVVASPPDRLELTTLGGFFGGGITFTNPSHQPCALDDVAVDRGSLAFAPGAFEQEVLQPGGQLEVRVLALADAGTPVDAGALHYHVLAPGQPVRRIGLVVVP